MRTEEEIRKEIAEQKELLSGLLNGFRKTRRRAMPDNIKSYLLDVLDDIKVRTSIMLQAVYGDRISSFYLRRILKAAQRAEKHIKKVKTTGGERR